VRVKELYHYLSLACMGTWYCCVSIEPGWPQKPWQEMRLHIRTSMNASC
jgi:hypothetical protein